MYIYNSNINIKIQTTDDFTPADLSGFEGTRNWQGRGPNIGFWSHWFSMPWEMGIKGHPWSRAETPMTGQCPKANHHFCDDHTDWRQCAIGVGTPSFIKRSTASCPGNIYIYIFFLHPHFILNVSLYIF